MQEDDIDIRCRQCNQNKVVRKTSILQFPRYLIIHLHRFEETEGGLRQKCTPIKIEEKISFHGNRQDMLGFVDKGIYNYQLYGVLHH
jgi:ubiquitin C-terminal hydrolase